MSRRRPGFAESVLSTLQDLGGWRTSYEVAEVLGNEEPRNVARSLGNTAAMTGAVRKRREGDRLLWQAGSRPVA